MELMQRGYNEGYFQAFGDCMRMVLKSIKDKRDLLDTDKRYLSADVRLQAKQILQKKKLMPYEYDIIMGKAKDVKCPWDN